MLQHQRVNYIKEDTCSANSISLLIPPHPSPYLPTHNPSSTLIHHPSYLIPHPSSLNPHTSPHLTPPHPSYLIPPRFFGSSYLIPHTSVLQFFIPHTSYLGSSVLHTSYLIPHTSVLQFFIPHTSSLIPHPLSLIPQSSFHYSMIPRSRTPSFILLMGSNMTTFVKKVF